MSLDYGVIGEIAAELGVAPAFVEKDWYSVQVLKTIAEYQSDTISTIFSGGKAEYRLHELKQICDKQLASVDCLLTPTAGKCFTIEEMLAEPILRNSQLGQYTNFMNLLDLASVAIPTQIADNDLPFGVTLVGDVFSDRIMLSIANRVHSLFTLNQGAS